MARFMRRQPASYGHSELRPPAVVGAGIVYRPIDTTLFAVRRRVRQPRYEVQSNLGPPTVVTEAAVFIAPPIQITYWAAVKSKQNTALNRRQGTTKLRPPVVVTPAFVAPPVSINYWASVKTKQSNALTRRQPYSRLRPPAVVNDTQIFFGPQITYWTAVKSKQNTSLNRRQAISRLFPPIIPPLARPVDVTLAPQRRGRPLSHLGPPTVVFTAVELSGPETHLARIRPPRTETKLQPPAVVDAVVVEAYYGPQVTLAPSSRLPRATHSVLRAPAVVGAGLSFHGPGTYLTRPSRGVAKSRLAPPTVTTVTAAFYGPQVHLARGRRPAVRSLLRPPIIPPLAEPTRTALAASRRGRGEARLFPPTVINTDRYFGPHVTLAPSKRGKPLSRLQPPTVVNARQSFFGPQTHLTRGKAGRPFSFLAPPIIPPLARPIVISLTRIRPRPTITTIGVFPPQAVVYAPLTVHLTYSRRGAPYSFLRGLPIGVSDVYTGPKTHLAYSLQGKPKSRLLPVKAGIAPARPIKVTLARTKPKPTTTLLRPPTVVQAATLLFFGPKTELTYSRRGRPLSRLKPPAVVGAGRFFRPILVSLAPSPTPQRAIHSKLRAPRVVRLAVEIYGPEVSLAPSRFPKPKSRLRPPTVVNREPFRPVQTQLAYSRRGTPKPFLNPPTVTFRQPNAPLTVHLTYSRRGAPTWFLRPPVIPPLALPIRVTLTRIAPRPTVALVKPPTVVFYPPNRGLLVHLTYSLRGAPKSLLKPPTVVEPAEQFFGPLVTLTRITHPPVRWLLKPPTVVVTQVPGDVDCDDSTPYEVDCETEQAGFVAGAATASGDTISGTDSGNGQSLSGSDRATGNAEAGDRRS